MVSLILPHFNRVWLSEPRPAAKQYARVPLVESTMKNALARVKKPTGKNFSLQTVSALSLVDTSTSLTQHILEIIPSVGPKHVSVKGLGFLSSGMDLLLASTVTVGNGVADLNKSHRIGDGEGMRCASAQVVSGSISTGSSIFSFAHKIVDSISALGFASNAFYGVGSSINIGVSGWGIYRCAKFHSKIDTFLDSKRLNERERVVQVLRFFKEKIAPTSKELREIQNEINKLHPKWGPLEKQRAIRKQALDLSEVKLRYFKRRTCLTTAMRVLKEVDKHLAQLNGPLVDGKNLEAAKNLIAEVKRKNKNKILLSAIVAFTSLIALAGFIAGTFFSLGILPFVLYAVASAIALCLLLYPMIVDNLRASKASAMESRAASLASVTFVVSDAS